MTVAVRGPSSSSAISPNESPGPSWRRSCPPTSTVAVPSAMTKNAEALVALGDDVIAGA